MATSPKVFTRELVQLLSDAAVAYARPRIHSKTLSNAIFSFVQSDTKGGAQIPHYWAVYLNDGRGSFGPVSKKVLIYFRDPKDDPRLKGGVSPERYASVRSLTTAEFRFWAGKNTLARRDGRPVPMIVRRRVGPMHGTGFFENNRGMNGFVNIANGLAFPKAISFLRTLLGPLTTIQRFPNFRVRP